MNQLVSKYFFDEVTFEQKPLSKCMPETLTKIEIGGGGGRGLKEELSHPVLVTKSSQEEVCGYAAPSFHFSSPHSFSLSPATCTWLAIAASTR